jgi:hypothetical protein
LHLCAASVLVIIKVLQMAFFPEKKQAAVEAVSKLRSRQPLACRLGSFPSEGASGTLALPCSKQVLK